MNSESTRWYEKLKGVIGQSKTAELLETRKQTLGYPIGRRDFMKYSSMAGMMMGAIAVGNRAGVVSPRDVTNQVKKLAGMDAVTNSSGVILPTPLAMRQSYLQWMGVKEVANPTYERFFTGSTLPATISEDSPDYPKLDTSATTAEQYVPFATNLLGSSDPNPDSEIAADIFQLYPYQPVNPATMNTDDRIWYEFNSAVKGVVGMTNISSTFAAASTVSENQVTGVTDTQWSFLMKKFGLMFGMTNVGITQTKPNVHIGTDALANGYYGDDATANTTYPNLIVMAAAQPNQMNKIVSKENSLGATTSTYNVGNYLEITYDFQADLLNLTTLKMTNFIKSIGYNAIPFAISSGTFQVPMMIDAGMGEGSRCARCLTPDYGHNIVPTAVMTDLPLAYDKPIDFNLYNFCMRCEVCADVCPSGSRPRGPPTLPRNGLNRQGMKYWFDGASCHAYWSSYGGCQLCLAYCPWSEPRTWYHDLGKWAAINMGDTGIDTLVSLYKGDLANRRVERSSYLWSPDVEGVPSGRADVNLPPPW